METQGQEVAGTAQCPIEGDHVQHLWNPGASFGNTLQFWCPGRFENDGTDIKFEIAATVVKKYDDPDLTDD